MGFKADVWSFGLLLHEIYAGVEDKDFPLPTDDYDELVELAKAGKLTPTPLPHTCAVDVRNLYARCVEVNVEKRASVKELLALLDTYSWSPVV